VEAADSYLEDQLRERLGTLRERQAEIHRFEEPETIEVEPIIERLERSIGVPWMPLLTLGVAAHRDGLDLVLRMTRVSR